MQAIERCDAALPPRKRRSGSCQARRSTRSQCISVTAALLRAKGVSTSPKVRDGSPVVEGDRVLDVANVIWCTGFRGAFGWIDLPIFGDDGRPLQERGVAGEAEVAAVGIVNHRMRMGTAE